MIAKSAAFCLVGRKRRSGIVGLMNDFGVPCLILNQVDEQIEENIKSIACNEKEVLQGIYIVMTEAEARMKGSLVGGDNVWQI